MRGWMMAMLVGLLPLAGLAQPGPPAAPPTAPAAAPAPEATTQPPARQPSPAQQAQQERMTSCNAEAASRAVPADGRRAFMRECLAGRLPPATAPAAAPAAAPSQQDRMRRCNADAGTRELTGEPRRVFMRECLSGGATPTANRGGVASAATTYSTEGAARTACAEDAVVWGNGDTRVFHLQGSRFYGKTQNGAYLCRGAAEMAGYRAAR